MSKTAMQPLHVCLAGLACFTWLLPARVQAAGPANLMRPASLVRDLALDSQGRIAGQLVDAQGQPKPDQLVVAHRQGRAQRETRTDARGRFVLDGLTGGLYQIATTDSAVVCRCWSEQAAPPAATRELLIVSGDGVERGQRPIGELLFSAPVLIALVIAAAIAIPIAVHNSQDAS